MDKRYRYTYRELAAMSASELDRLAQAHGLEPERMAQMRNSEIITHIIRKQAGLK